MHERGADLGDYTSTKPLLTTSLRATGLIGNSLAARLPRPRAGRTRHDDAG